MEKQLFNFGTQLKSFKYCYLTLLILLTISHSDATTPGQSGAGNSGNERVLHIP